MVRRLLSLARHVIVLMGTGEQREWLQALHRRFRGKARPRSPQFPNFYRVLLEMGIYADVRILPTSCNYVYEDEDALIDDWMQRLHLDDSHREELRTALLQIAQWHGDHIGIYGYHRTALIWMDRERSMFNKAN